MKAESVAIKSLVLDPSNARKHSPKNLEAIKGSLAKFGQQKPIVVGKGNVVIAGNGTLEAARALGWDEIAVVRTKLEGTDATAFAIADNRTGELAEWDAGVLSETLKSLDALDFDLDAIGFSQDDLDKMIAEPLPAEGLTDPDAVPENVETRCKPGDLWILGNHRLLCGDSTNIKDVERVMAGEMADCIWTDPPYNVAVCGGTRDFGDKKNHGKGPRIANDKMGDAEFRDFLRATYACMFAVTKPGAAIYVAHADTEGINFRSAFIEAGFLLKQCLIWAKQQFVFGRSDYHWQHEPILYGWKEGAAHEFYGERNQSTVWNVDRPMRSDKEHPTQKPVALVEKAIMNSSRPGQLLFEPFTGGGSTLIASEKTGRRCFGMELDPKYCDVILARWEAFTGKQATLETR